MSRRLWIAVVALALALAACSDDQPPPPGDGGDAGRADGAPPSDGAVESCSLSVSQINGRAASKVSSLTGSDDRDTTKPGIQVDVQVTAKNAADGKEIGLSVTSLAPDPTAKLSGGVAEFKAVSVAVTLSSVLIRAYADGCRSGSAVISVAKVPECEFVDPSDKDRLGRADDKTSGNSSFDYDVVVQTRNAKSAKVTLKIDGTPTGSDQIPGSDGRVTFADTVLPKAKSVKLSADVKVGGTIRSCNATISVSTDAPKCDLALSPTPISTFDSKKGLGKAQDSNTATSGIETDIAVTTDSVVDRVALFVDGVQVSTAQASGGKASLTDVKISDGRRRIHAVCADTTTGNSGQTQDLRLEVDSSPPGQPQALSCVLADRRRGSVSCAWTSAGSPEVMRYEVRYGKSTVTTGNWAGATRGATAQALPRGQRQSLDVDKVTLGARYSFAVRAQDNVKNQSTIAQKQLLVDYSKATRSGVTASSAWGSRMATGDFDCDGFTDLAVGDPAAGSGLGRVYIFLGSANGYLASPEKVFSGTVSGGRFGEAVAAIGNFDEDADSCGDLAVLASHGGTSQARIYVYLGRKALFDRSDVATGTGAELILELASGAPTTTRIGEGLASAGDFDGDGASDLAIARRDTAASTSGAVQIVFGDKALKPLSSTGSPKTTTLAAARSVTVSGASPQAAFGASICGGRSLDSDSVDDLVIGAKSTQIGGTTRGALYVVKGASAAGDITLSDSRVIRVAGGSGNGSFGEQVAIIGDMDGDKSIEFAGSDTSVSSKAGAVYVFSLGTSAPKSVTDAAFTVTNANTSSASDRLGAALACNGGDVDGDGKADLLVGAEERGTNSGGAYLFSGESTLSKLTTSDASHTFGAPSSSVAFGTNIVWADDINKDGFIDLIIGDPKAGGGKGLVEVIY